MTSGCSHSGTKPTQGLPFRYNPFEIAVCGSDPALRGLLLAQLTVAYERHYSLGQVMVRESQMDTDTVDRMGVSLVRGDEQHGLIYPAGMDHYIGARPLIDVDLVFIESVEPIDVPKLVVIGDGPVLDEYSGVLAYVGKPEACPILPSDAPYFRLARIESILDCVDAHFTARVEAIPLYGLVLAGGYSTRMGEDKGALTYHEKPQVRHCFDLIAPFCERTFVSCRREQENDPGHEGLLHIPDAFLGFGPMGGILSALKAERDAAWLVLACDLPYVDEKTLETLIRNRNPFKLATAFVSARDEFPEPLCAVYEPKSLYRLLHFLALGYHCPRKVLINSDTQLLDPPDGPALDNINLPEERDAALASLKPRKEMSR